MNCCRCCKSRNKVFPLDDVDKKDNFRILQVRKKRYVCVYYFNPCPRSKHFNERMQSVLHSFECYRPETSPRFKRKNGSSRCTSPLASCSNLTEETDNSQYPLSPTLLHVETNFGAQNGGIQCNNLQTSDERLTGIGSEFQPLDNCKDKIKHPDKVLFFIHGVGGSADIWNAQTKYFTDQGYELVVPEWIGHGLCPSTSKEKDYYFSEILQDLTLVFDMHCKQTNVIIGHSYGCCFAAALARTRPRLVQRLMLISGGAPTPLAPQPGLFKCPTCCLACCKPLLKQCLLKRAFSKSSQSIIDVSKAFAVPTYVIKYTMNGQRWPQGDADYHSRISCPTMLVHGADDRLISVEEELDMQETIFGSELYVLDDASHMVMMEKPDAVNALIQSLICDQDFMAIYHTQSVPSLDSDQPDQQHVQLTTQHNSDAVEDNGLGSNDSSPVKTNRSELKSARHDLKSARVGLKSARTLKSAKAGRSTKGMPYM